MRYRLPSDVLWHNAWWGPFASTGAILILQFISHSTLLWSMSSKGKAVRKLLMLISLFFWTDLTLDRQITLGSRLRSLLFGALAWSILAKTLTVGIVFDMDHPERPPPQWIVPDWKAEAGKTEDDKTEKCVNGLQTSTHTDGQWLTLSSRPAWARKANVIPRFWKTLPYPTTMRYQLLWTLDVWLTRRPGTSWFCMEEMRALDWSRERLQVAGTAQHIQRTSANPPNVRVSGDVQPFGYVETTFLRAIADTILFIICMAYMSTCNFPGSSYGDYYALPIKDQFMLALCIGVCVAMSGTLAEYLLVPSVQRWPLHVPATAVVPTFRDVSQSQSLSDLWSFRWHAMSKRDFVACARLLPLGHRKNRVALMFKVFFLSGVMHSMLFLHVLPVPDWTQPLTTIIPMFFLPGPMAFFLLQACLIMLEQTLGLALARRFALSEDKTTSSSSSSSSSKSHRWTLRAIGVAQNVWTWFALIFTAQFLAAELVRWNLVVQDEIVTMQPLLIVKDFTKYFIDRLSYR